MFTTQPNRKPSNSSPIGSPTLAHRSSQQQLILQRHEQLNKYIDSMQKHIQKIILSHDSQFLLAYRTHIKRVKQEMEQIKRKSSSNNDINSSTFKQLQKIESLQKQLIIFREQALKLFDKLTNKDKTIQLLQMRVSELQTEKKFDVKTMKRLIKRNKYLQGLLAMSKNQESERNGDNKTNSLLLFSRQYREQQEQRQEERQLQGEEQSGKGQEQEQQIATTAINASNKMNTNVLKQPNTMASTLNKGFYNYQIKNKNKAGSISFLGNTPNDSIVLKNNETTKVDNANNLLSHTTNILKNKQPVTSSSFYHFAKQQPSKQFSQQQPQQQQCFQRRKSYTSVGARKNKGQSQHEQNEQQNNLLSITKRHRPRRPHPPKRGYTSFIDHINRQRGQDGGQQRGGAWECQQNQNQKLSQKQRQKQNANNMNTNLSNHNSHQYNKSYDHNRQIISSILQMKHDHNSKDVNELFNNTQHQKKGSRGHGHSQGKYSTCYNSKSRRPSQATYSRPDVKKRMSNNDNGLFGS